MGAPVIGFVGLGFMGEAMARNLVRAGTPLLVWNRNPAKATALADEGAEAIADVAELFGRADVIILMLANAEAIDAVLRRGTPEFAGLAAGRTIVHMGTTEPAYSLALEADIRAVGGHYVEAPVSGSRVPAENGELVAMLAGEPDAVERVRPLLAPMCRDTTICGPVPGGLVMKLSVNIYLITVVTGLAEAFQFAKAQGLDLDRFVDVLNNGQMSSPIMRVKGPKLLNDEFSAQAAIADVLTNNRLITGAAREAGIPVPLIDVCEALYAETVDLGLGGADMSAVVKAIEARAHDNADG
ncbi:MAG TPA: NAD(P)-dependent oxidoreductase [Pseudonocardiaceae bacterium]|nr:NAD(P)-dependent oxidoreductase [Pseudonocardiaceae bacterium]